MPRGNGGVLGPANIPTTSVAKGVWSLMEQQLAQRQNIWPTVFDPYFEYTTLLLPGNGTNGAQNNTFLDGSTNNFTITRNGNTTQGTFSPFSQTGWGNYFDGTGDYLTSPNNTAVDFGSGSFTFETWFYPAVNITDARSLFSKRANTSVYAPFVVEFNASMAPIFYFSTTGSSWNQINSSVSCVVNAWNHVAITRNGSTFTIWINGVSGGTTTNASALMTNTDAVSIGAAAADGSRSINGYMSSVRMVKGTALYTSNFTPPTAPLTAISGTSLLTCQSNRFIDNSSNNFTITRNGDTRVVAFSPFNPSASWSAATYGGSGYFDGNGDYLTIPDDASWDLSSSTGSMELFVYPPVAATGTPGLIGQCPTTANWSIYIYSDGRIAVGIQGVSELATAGGSLIVNSMNHIVITRDSGTSRTRLFVNGILKATGTGTYFNNSSASLHIGYFNGYSFNGYISEVRFCKGSIPTTYQTSSITVGDSIFTPPSAPITTSSQGATSGDVKLLLNFTNAGIYDATSKNDLETVGNAQISTTQSKWGGSSMAFDGTGDYLINGSINSTFYQFETGDFTVEFWLYPTTVSVVQYLIDFRDPTIPSGAAVYLFLSASAKLAIYVGPNAVITASTTSISANTWTHIALVKNGTGSNNYKLYINGNADATTGTYTNILTFGFLTVAANSAQRNTAATDKLNGYLQDLRITKGYARYVTGTGANAGQMVFNGTNTLALPTAAFPTL